MKIDKKHLYHGAALTQVVEHPSFTALNKASSAYGHYEINSDIRLFVKYATGAGAWQFTFVEDHLIQIRSDGSDPAYEAYVALVCADQSVALVGSNEIWQLLEWDAADGRQQWIRVAKPPRSQLRVSSSRGVDLKVPTNRFPDDLFS